MLQSIREKSKGWLAYVIVGLISIPFMFFGIQQYLGGGGERLVAEVNGVEITGTQFDRMLRLQQQRLRDMFGGRVPPGMLEGDAINQSVLNSMVRDEVMRQYAEEEGYRVSEKEVITAIQAQPEFQDNGQFSAERFDQLLSAQRRDKAGYVRDVQMSMQIGQLQSAIGESAFVIPSEYAEFQKLNNQIRDVEFLQILQSAFSDSVEIADAEIETYYQENPGAFLSDEKVKLNYLLLDLDALEKQVEVSEELLRSYYEEEKDRFLIPATRSAQHILVPLDKGIEYAEEVAERIRGGEAFDAVAAEVSSDKLTAEKGGDLGFVHPGDMDPEFEKALFSLGSDELSDPVETALGFHLIKYSEETAPIQRSFDEARGDLEKEYRQNEADRLVVDKTEQLLTLTYENHSSLDQAADALGLEVQTSDWITRQGADGIWREPKLITAAFSDEVLKEKRNSQVLETGDGKQVALRVADHELAAPLPLEDVKTRIVSILKAQKAGELIREAGAKVLVELDAGKTLAVSAETLETEVQSLPDLKRDSASVSPEISAQLFKMSPPQDGKISRTGFELANGDFVVAVLNEVKFAELDKDDIDSQINARLVGQSAQSEVDALLRAMESRADIKIFTENLQQE